MPRPATFRPTKRGQNWYLYVPDRGMLDLGKLTKEQAFKEAAKHRAAHASMGASKKTADAQPKAPPLPPQPATAPSSMLATWAEKAPQEAAPDSAPLSASAPTEEATPVPAASPEPTALTTEQKVDGLMSPDKRKKVADLMAKLATRVEILLAGATVRVFGRVPGPVDPDEKEVLQEGTAMMIDEFFVSTPPRPWMVVVGASVGIGIGMYVDGTPIPKTPKLAPPSVRLVEDEPASSE